MKNTTAILILFFTPSISAAADRVATVSGSDTTVPFVNNGKTVLLDAAAAAKAFNWKLKIIRPGKLIAFCRDSGCVPVRLTAVNSKTADQRLFVDAIAIGRALSFSVQRKNGSIRLIRIAPSKSVADKLPAYNAKWGPGRGFRVGQTLPDIPLVDLDGREVRFSKFLGKQYIIYCWASW